MKKRLIFLVAAIACFLAIAGIAHATAIAAGNMNFTGLNSDNIRLNRYNLGFAHSYQSDSSGGNLTQDNFYLDPTTYSGSGAFGLNRVAGNFDPATGASVATEVYAQSRGDGYTTTMSADFTGFATYNGVLDPFSYDFEFYGETDSADSRLIYTVQIEIAYRTGSGSDDYHYVYSDYRSWADDFRTNWFHQFDADSEEIYSGTRSFDYSSLGSQNWEIAWDFIINARDFSDVPSSAPVPEPSTMILFGLGLLGLSSISRKRKK